MGCVINHHEIASFCSPLTVVGEKSPYHSLIPGQGVLSANACYVNNPVRLSCSISSGLVVTFHEDSRSVFEQPERRYWSARTTVLLAIVASLLLGFIAGRLSAGLRPKFGWPDGDILFVVIMWVLLVIGALSSVWPRKRPQRDDSRSTSLAGQ
jgi:hypothetical protein